MQCDVAALYRRVVLVILIILVTINSAWFLINKHSGPFWGLIAYTIILILCLRQHDFRAGIVGGLLGLSVHLYELVILGVEDLTSFELLFFLLNLIFPLLLMFSSYRAYEFRK